MTIQARASLNYKGVPYKTEWTEYPDVAPTLKKAGIAPHDPSASPMGMSTLSIEQDRIKTEAILAVHSIHIASSPNGRRNVHHGIAQNC
jgi:hypothetical protein